jgi:hypothetical protein
MKKLFTLLVLILHAVIGVQAQPSDAQIIKDLTKPGVLKVELTNRTTKKEWNSAHAQYMWSRGATVWRNADISEYPDAKIIIIGFARYHYGASTSFREFKVAESTYEGIPAPRGEEILSMIRGRYMQFLGWRAGDMIGDLHYLRIANEDGVIWHTPNSFTVNTEIEFDAKTSNTEVTTIQEKVEVRFYRDAINDPWKDKINATSRERKDGEVKKYSAEELSAMPTMKQLLQEQAAQESVSALPKVDIPEFNSDMDVFLYTHKMLREATRDEMHAYLMHMLAPTYFVEGSTTQLNRNGADLINKVLDMAYNGKSSYAQQYCPDPGVKHQQTNMMEWWNATQDKKTRCAVGLYGGGWKNGQKVGETFKITALDVWLWIDADNIARINSYEPGMLCRNSEQGTASPTPGLDRVPQSQESEESGLLKKGKGLLNQITGP